MKKIVNLPKHVAIILDGNGRWAQRRGIPRNIGHYHGGMHVAKIASYANELGIEQLTLYAFSTENWKRPEAEVDYLMTKPVDIIEKNLDRILESTIKIEFAGRKDRVPQKVLEMMSKLERLTKHHEGMKLVLCFDYGSQDELIAAFKQAETFEKQEIEQYLMVPQPVDLLIRPGGELRLSNFLLWQAAYAELYFTKKYWPEFSKKALYKACLSFSKRHRKFGGLKA